MTMRNKGKIRKTRAFARLLADRLLGRPRSCPECQSMIENDSIWRERHNKVTCPVCGFVLEDKRRGKT